MSAPEFRYVERWGDGSTVIQGCIAPAGMRVLVLQVRYREGPRGEDWWGEWQEVPFVPIDAEE